jgi:hypothetical protein
MALDPRDATRGGVHGRARVSRNRPAPDSFGFADGLPVLAFFRPGSTQPAYFVRLEREDGRVVHIRDFRYVPYIAEGAQFTKA